MSVLLPLWQLPIIFMIKLTVDHSVGVYFGLLNVKQKQKKQNNSPFDNPGHPNQHQINCFVQSATKYPKIFRLLSQKNKILILELDNVLH